MPAPTLSLRRPRTSGDVAYTTAPHPSAAPRRRLLVMKVKFDARQDYYARLQVDKTATLTDIKRSYRKLALKTHPDVNKYV